MENKRQVILWIPEGKRKKGRSWKNWHLNVKARVPQVHTFFILALGRSLLHSGASTVQYELNMMRKCIKGQSRGSKKYEKERKHGVICKLFSNDNMPYTSLLISLGGIDPSAINGLSSSKQSLNEGTIASQRFRLRRICLIRATVRPC